VLRRHGSGGFRGRVSLDHQFLLHPHGPECLWLWIEGRHFYRTNVTFGRVAMDPCQIPDGRIITASTIFEASSNFAASGSPHVSEMPAASSQPARSANPMLSAPPVGSAVLSRSANAPDLNARQSQRRRPTAPSSERLLPLRALHNHIRCIKCDTGSFRLAGSSGS
jgi:hypothetical protein